MTAPLVYRKRVVDVLDSAQLAGFTREDFLQLAHAALDQATGREDVATAAPAFKAIETFLREEER